MENTAPNLPKLQSKYFVGDSLDSKWASVYGYKPQSAEIFAAKGEVFAVFKLVTTGGFNAVTAGNLLVDQFHESYFESKKEGVVEALTDAITATTDRLTQLLEHEVETANQGVDLDVAAIAIRANEIYFASLGDNKIHLLVDKKEPKLHDISEQLKDPFGKGLVKVGSSFVQPDQRYLLATPGVHAEYELTQIRDFLERFSDTHFMNDNHQQPESLAMFMIGVDLVQNSFEEVATTQANLRASLESDPRDIAGARDFSSQNDSEGNAEDTSVGVDPEFQETVKNPQNSLESESLSSSKTGDASREKLEEEPEEEMEPEIAPASEAIAGFISDLRGRLRELPQQFKKLQERRRQQQEINKLREVRANQAQASERGETNLSHVPTPRRDLSQYSTVQALGLRALDYLRSGRDILLYDILKVNQRNYYELRKDPNFVRMLGIVGVVVTIFIGFLIVRSIAEGNARAAQIVEARDRLTVIEAEIDDLASNPVLNTNSSSNIGLRQDLLAEIVSLEGQFGSELEILPEAEVDEQRQRLVQLRRDAQLEVVADTPLLSDIGNFFEGNISDITVAGENVFVADATRGAVYRQPVRGGNPEPVTENIAGATSLATDANGSLIVYRQGGEALSILDPATGNFSSIPGLSDTTLGGVAQIALYDVTNGVYTVGPGVNGVQLLNRSGSSYSFPQSRFSDPTVSNIRDIAIIDARIILLSNLGLYRVEVPDPASTVEAFADVEQALTGATAMGANSTYTFVADNAGDRLLIFANSRGVQPIFDFVAQVPLTDIPDQVTEITASDSVAYIAAGNRIYSLNLSFLD